jgi:hypothetical protein
MQNRGLDPCEERCHADARSRIFGARKPVRIFPSFPDSVWERNCQRASIASAPLRSPRSLYSLKSASF